MSHTFTDGKKNRKGRGALGKSGKKRRQLGSTGELILEDRQDTGPEKRLPSTRGS